MSEYVSLGECHLVGITKWSNSSWKSYQGRCLAQIRKVLLLLRPAAVWLVDLCGHLWHLWPSCRLLLISVNNVNIYQYVKWKFKWSLMNMNTGSDSRGYGPVCFFSLNTEWELSWWQWYFSWKTSELQRSCQRPTWPLSHLIAQLQSSTMPHIWRSVQDSGAAADLHPAVHPDTNAKQIARWSGEDSRWWSWISTYFNINHWTPHCQATQIAGLPWVSHVFTWRTSDILTDSTSWTNRVVGMQMASWAWLLWLRWGQTHQLAEFRSGSCTFPWWIMLPEGFWRSAVTENGRCWDVAVKALDQTRMDERFGSDRLEHLVGFQFFLQSLFLLIGFCSVLASTLVAQGNFKNPDNQVASLWLVWHPGLDVVRSWHFMLQAIS